MQAQFDFALRIAIALVMLTATILFGIGTHSPVLPLVTLVLTPLAAYVTDFKGWFRFSQAGANFVASCVIASAAFQAAVADRAGQLITVGALQSYLQYVLLFQPKTSRVFWQLGLLSLGQLAIAATMLTTPIFGALLVFYVFAGTVAYGLLLVRRQTTRVAVSSMPRGARWALPWRSEFGWGRWALAWSPTAAPSVHGGPVLIGSSAGWSWRCGLELAKQATLISLTSVPIAAAIYFVLPRWTILERQVVGRGPVTSVGFSRTVELGELGNAVNNPDIVMRVQLFHGWNREPFKLASEPLFQGSVLNFYNGHLWTQTRKVTPQVMARRETTNFARQRITMEPSESSELFAIPPAFALREDRRLRADNTGDQLFRVEESRSRQVEFEVGTIGIDGDRQRAILPCNGELGSSRVFELLQMPPIDDPDFDAFPALRERAASVLREQGIDVADRAAAARALSDHFHSSGKYFYSLDPQIRDPELDPLEDFVAWHPYGHCEYFAGALVMMLRSQGIPARMVVGYKGGEWNSVGEYYQVQELHAHAWVEAYLPRTFIPADAFGDELPRAAWLVLDPTEGTQEGPQGPQALGLLAQLRQYLDFAEMLWNNYVVGMNAGRQRQGIYDPVAQGLVAGYENLTSGDVWRARAQAVSHSPVGDFWLWYRGHWFSWRGGLVAVGFSLCFVGSYFGLRRAAAILLPLVLGSRGPLQRDPPVHEIYRRLETVLAESGYRRQSSQTAYEFAMSVGGDLVCNAEQRRVAHLPGRIVEAFYRVRFGGHALDNSEAEAVEHALDDLKLALGRIRTAG